MITLTSAAGEFVRQSAEGSGAQGLVLRVAAAWQGDGSLGYALGFDEAKDDDRRVQSEGVEIVCEEHQVVLLEGLTIDYVEIEPGQMKLIFLNPNDPHFVPPKEGGKGRRHGGGE